ncbi:hypothetical protein KI387_024534 [Taxus chinensis]|uniref:t-SNARE coiled-coil homology domain-containing protein n=1 Tax=Taxus chinensis TaxID=29808 RepID=A0AA38LD04_TAXCH|nr:hypothetical protein KI387_024534 [Taxus chinensis]
MERSPRRSHHLLLHHPTFQEHDSIAMEENIQGQQPASHNGPQEPRLEDLNLPCSSQEEEGNSEDPISPTPSIQEGGKNNVDVVSPGIRIVSIVGIMDKDGINVDDVVYEVYSVMESTVDVGRGVEVNVDRTEVVEVTAEWGYGYMQVDRLEMTLYVAKVIMNDLLSKSFSREKDNSYESIDIEMGGMDPEKNLAPFFSEVGFMKTEMEQIKQLLVKLKEANEESKTVHKAQAMKALRERMQKDVEQVLRKAKFIKGKLEQLDKANEVSRSVAGCEAGSSTDRTRNGYHQWPQKFSQEFDGGISEAQRGGCPTSIRRRLREVTGQRADEDTIEQIIQTGESENMLQRAIEEQGRGQIIDVINEIQERHDAVKDIEKNLLELHQLFLDMSVLVQAQGEEIDNIEAHVGAASSFVQRGTVKLAQAKKLQKNTRNLRVLQVIISLHVTGEFCNHSVTYRQPITITSDHLVTPEKPVNLVDASRKDVGKLLERVGDRRALARKKKENTAIHNGSRSLGRKKQNSAIQGENAMFYQRQSCETNFHTLPSCGMIARTKLDFEPSIKGNDENHTKNNSAERHEDQNALNESEDDIDKEEFDWEDGNVMPCVGSIHGHPRQWSEEITIELEDDDTSMHGRKRSLRRATARDKEFAEVVHKVHLLCLIGRGMLIDAACNDSLIQASLYSLLPSKLLNLGKEHKLTANTLTDFVKWFQNIFHVQSSDEGSSQPEDRRTFIAKLCHAIECRAGTREEVAALSVALLRALGLSTRYVSVLDVAPLKPDAESLEASADWNSDSDSEDGQKLLHMNSTKTTIASLGQVLARCPYQVSTQNTAISNGGSESQVRRGRGSKKSCDNRDSVPEKRTSETAYPRVQLADGEQKATVTQHENSVAINSEGQDKGVKRKGDLEFEMELAMAISATATEAQRDSRSKNNMISNDISDRVQADMFASTSEGGQESKKPRISAQQKSTAVWSRKLAPCFHWAEVYCEGETFSGRWVHVDAANGIIDGESKVEEAVASCKRPLCYVLAFAGNGAKDVTCRYVTKWSTIVPQRVSSPWWEVTMAPLKELEAVGTAEALDIKTSKENAFQSSISAETSIPATSHHGNNTIGSQGSTNLDSSQVCDMSARSPETPGQRVHVTDRNSLEDMELETRTFTEPLPTNQQAYKNHHLYALERWLTKYQTLYPTGPVLGYCAGKPVYPRTCVQNLHTAERWLREGLQVKKGEAPAKILEPSRNRARRSDAEATNLEEGCSEGRTVALFGRWQTEPLKFPSAINGIVPKNERGQVDVWSEKCLPPGTVHLRMPRLVPIAKKLGIDFAPAMVGFEFRNGRSVPIFEGIVVCKEFRNTILQAYSEEEEIREIEEKKRNEHQAISRWNQLLRSIATRQRLRNDYQETHSNTSKLSVPSTVEYMECVASTSTDGANNAADVKRDDIMQVSGTCIDAPSLGQEKDDLARIDETIKYSKTVSVHNHVHLFPNENKTYDEDGAIWTKRCPCGFSIQVEEM